MFFLGCSFGSCFFAVGNPGVVLNLDFLVAVSRVKRVLGQPRPLLAGTGAPWVSCRDPPVCHRVLDDSCSKASTLCVRLVCAPVILSPPSNVLLSFSSVEVFRIVKRSFFKPAVSQVFGGMWEYFACAVA